MLTEIKLTNFKCFKEETSIPLSNFNLFTGVNGAGKSTVLQVLLLMRQSIESNPYTTELILNGSCVNLGSFDDVKNRDVSASESIFFAFSINKKIIFNSSISSLELNKNYESISELDLWYGSISYQLKNNKNVGLSISDMMVNNLNEKRENYKFSYSNGVIEEHSNIVRASRLHKLELVEYDIDDNRIRGSIFSFDKTHFISADRIGPQEFYKKSALSNFLNVGKNGEFAVNLLNTIKEDQLLVNEALCLGDEEVRSLLIQTQAWIGKILNPLSLETKSLGKTNFLELLIGGFKPSNVGFGYSSILPIIVTGLIAKPGEKIIIENPEIHLHPKAQSALIEFLIKVANTGVQVFIESHSDHVLNALRIATKNNLLKPEENLLKPEDSSVLFFSQNQETKVNEITSILIDEKGKLHKKTQDGTVAKIPKGFFDEWTNSMAKLF